MPPKSPWNWILCARTTSQAIELAADVPLPELSNTPLPVNFDKLSFHAQANARAVRRALGVRIDGLKETGWELWEETEEEKALFRLNDAIEEDDEGGEKTGSGEQQEHDGTPSSFGEESDTSIVENSHRSRAVLDDEQHASSKKKPRQDGGSTDILKHTEGNENASLVRPPVQGTKLTPSKEEISAAEALKSWAISSPHTLPPPEAVDIVSRSGFVSPLLNIIVAKDALPQLLAPIISVFTENVGSGFAGNLMDTLILPYSKGLKAPAPRGIMQALVSFSERHWRVGVVFYESFSKEASPVTGAVAEIMVRITAVITLEGAMQALRAWCDATWGEDGIRVVEALLGRCKTEAGVAGLVVPALDRNIIGSEKSVRFGKLLFTVARDVPRIVEDFDQAMESICSRSAVFLAKRALTLLRGKVSKG